MLIVGFKAGGHDPSVVFFQDGKVVFAAEEERFTRNKFSRGSIPLKSFYAGLHHLGITSSEVDYWAVHHANPLIVAYRTILPFLLKPPRNFLEFRFVAIQTHWVIRRFLFGWFRGDLPYQKFFSEIKVKKPKIFFVEHHIAHGLSASLFCGLDTGISISMDGKGDGVSIMTAKFANHDASILNSKFFKVMKRYDPRYSLGLGYSELTKYLGFAPNDAEYKVMGLASYGKHIYNMSAIFGFEKNLPRRKVTSYIFWYKKSDDIKKFFNKPPRTPESDLDSIHMNIAASLQNKLEESVLEFSKTQLSQSNTSNLVLSGGVALNVKMNMILRDKLKLNNLFIQPVSSDAGLALGACGFVYKKLTGKTPQPLTSLHLGPSVVNFEPPDNFATKKLKYVKYPNYEALVEDLAIQIASGAVVAWMQGRMEFGPRALGARSILADPRLRSNQDRVNAKIKFRESFRPFCPSMLKSEFLNYVEVGTNWQVSKSLKFMIEAFSANSKALQEIPAVIHVDGTMRPQVIDETEKNESITPYLMLLHAFKKKTGIGVLLNTSLNRRGEPIACYPKEGLDIFLHTDLDLLVIDKYIISKI